MRQVGRAGCGGRDPATRRALRVGTGGARGSGPATLVVGGDCYFGVAVSKSAAAQMPPGRARGRIAGPGVGGNAGLGLTRVGFLPVTFMLIEQSAARDARSVRPAKRLSAAEKTPPAGALSPG